MPENLTPLNAIGEFALINRLQAGLTLRQPGSVLGIGDDAAIIRPTAGMEQVMTTDLLVEGIHFDLSFCPLRHLGYKAVAVNVSDIAAMNALPTQLVVALSVGPRFTVEAVEELYAGMRLACEAYNVDLVGGDTTASRGGLTLAVTVLGEVAAGQAARRSGGKPTDLLCVSGDLGGAFMGLQVLEREKQAFLADPETQPELANYEYVVQRQLRPEARLDIVHELRELGVRPTSMIDVSDGLASEVLHLCAASGTGARVFSEFVPLANPTLEAAAEFNLDPITCALNGGEDYELLFTVPVTDHEKIKNHPDITILGHLTDKADGTNLITKAGQPVPLKAQGWTSF
ncbi:thiamine-phosphate kinase [Hymenobacter properus]|uniref:Thiamine-monophosphate kinase n=1 Tax=Hymenobacter properus TaxID=2791026 RepID=A0A931FH62_9BACT|nr:thiamine-phosphate kinase [Hymenobacter properus]MBF9140712.1 thiamine-phosphate kinase [Hymenobacter properus]MBR7719520.1 thiamine-phosphate kinase [Microvirga sp. SRT04]